MGRIEEIRERREKSKPLSWIGRVLDNDDAEFYMLARDQYIPFLLAEVARLTAERDAAVEDLKIACQIGEVCATCRWCCNRGDQFPCDKHDDWCCGSSWQWRGAEPKEA